MTDLSNLAINQAAQVIRDDYAWLGVISRRYNAYRLLYKAEQTYSEARRVVRRVDDEMRTHYERLGADNSVPGRSVPALIDAAQRELGLGRFATQQQKESS